MIKILRNQHGYMLLNVIAFTLITSFSALFLMNGALRVRNSAASLKLVALHLANEQIAFLESRAASGKQIGGSYSFLGDEDDLISENLDENNPVTFEVKTHVSGSDYGDNLATVKITVKWQVDGKNYDVKAERTVYVAK